ncbi:MAG: helix-hairpin-helix domain-containing protein [Bacteroidales bacterium]|nr:helix-hairpin-helix domain-containing protein [Candidatus Cryptobacteroides caccocaballi]
MKRKKKPESDSPAARSMKAGAIALVFLVLGYQAAVFIHRAAVTKIISDRDRPDTVYVVDRGLAESVLGALPDASDGSVRGSGGAVVGGAYASGGKASPGGTAGRGSVLVRRNAEHDDGAVRVRESIPAEPESFRFDPNTVSVEDLQRLGFTRRQAESIDNYRRKGGHFSRKSDFARSYVVSEEVYARLEDYIDIPLLDINKADSLALTGLPGIGGWFASQILRHREELGSFSRKEQLLNVYRLDRERYDAISDLVFVSEEDAVPFRLWSLPADSLRLHPYIRSWNLAKAIVLYRENNRREDWTLEGLRAAGVLSEDQFTRLSRCLIE